MVNSRTLGILLDKLQGSTESPFATRPTAAVARTTPVARISRDASPSESAVAQPGARLAPDARTAPGARLGRYGTPSELTVTDGDRVAQALRPTLAAHVAEDVLPAESSALRGEGASAAETLTHLSPDVLVHLSPEALARRSPEMSTDVHAAAAPPARIELASDVGDTASLLHGGNVQTPSASLELSATAQWLQRSLLSVPAHEPAATIHASAPLMIATPGDGQALAHALRNSIAQSGLFYESHLADWTVQQYPESDLRREPQAGWTGTAATYGEMIATPEAADGDPFALRAGPIGDHANGQVSGQASGPMSVDLLRAQLQALESRQFSWQGELWPGQAASMTIAEDDATDRGDLPPAWRTHLTLTLPELGRVDVDLSLEGSTLKFAFAAGNAQSVELLKDARADLVSSLEAHRHLVASFGVRQS